MQEFVIFFILLIIIFLVTKKFSQNLFGFWYLLTRSKKIATNLTAFFIFPGTLIHEMNHFLFATFLGVRTGEFDLMPKITDGGIRMGSVQIAKCDFLRRSIIGLAPFFSGVTILYFLAKLIPSQISFEFKEILILSLAILGILMISNTMFSSKKDMEEIIPFIILIGIILGILWWFKIKISENILDFLTNIARNLNKVFLITIGVDLVFILLGKILIWFFQKILKRKIIFR